MMHNSTGRLGEILDKQIPNRPKYMGLNYEHVNKQKKYDPELKFMGDYDPTMSKPMSQHSKRQNGTRTKDNCYLWVPEEHTNSSTCLISKEDEVNLWHQKLGHLNLRGMKRVDDHQLYDVF
ncbi:gag-pol polyprotein, partial [Trifolium medium]|nr:gag-pol polyprotein [Trifolium medium]